MLKKPIFFLILIVSVNIMQGQEILARLSVTTDKISTQVDKKIFQTLQTTLVNFLNNRKWTNDVFQPNEKIQCNFLLSLEQDLANNIYKGRLTVQAARPVFNTT